MPNQWNQFKLLPSKRLKTGSSPGLLRILLGVQSSVKTWGVEPGGLLLFDSSPCFSYRSHLESTKVPAWPGSPTRVVTSLGTHGAKRHADQIGRLEKAGRAPADWGDSIQASIELLRHGFAPAGFRRFQGDCSAVALSEIDRNLLERCLARKPRAWEDFVDRFMGLVVHVINHTAQARGVRPTPEDRDDLCAEVFLEIIKDDFSLLRHFRGQSSLATYLTVVARRIVIRAVCRRQNGSRPGGNGAAEQIADDRAGHEERISNQEEVERLLAELQDTEAAIVRMYHLEGKSYQEISAATGMSENSIGPVLSRARNKMRRASVNQTAG